MKTTEKPTAVPPWEDSEPVSLKWWLLLISGIAWVIVGLVALQFNLDSAATIGYLVGGFLVVMGVTEFMLIGVTEGWHWVHAILGVLFVLTGVAGFMQPFQTFSILAHMFGFLLVLKGTFDLVMALALRHEVDLWWMTLT